MPSHIPYLGPAGISRIIDEMEKTQLGRGLVRSAVAKSQRAEHAELLNELNQMRPSDLETIGVALSRIERQKDLQAARLALTQLRLNAADQQRDLHEVRHLLTGR